MKLTRRNFLESAGTAALGAVVAASMPAAAESAPAAATPDDFDVDAAFKTFMDGIGGAPEDGGGKVTFIGRDPIVRSRFRLGACMALPAMAAGVGAAAIWKERTGQEQDVSVDLRESIYAIMPLIKLILQKKQALGRYDPDDAIPASFDFVPTLNGKLFQAPLFFDNPMSFAIFESKDGRYVTPTGLYPHHYHGVLNLIGASPNAESIRARIKEYDAFELDDLVAQAGLVMGVHRTAEEWAAHPEGKFLAERPLIEIVKVADGEPIPFDEKPEAPLSGVKAISCTHVIAGSTAARTLAEYGAEILHVARDQSFEHEIIWTDVNIGMRSSFVNLRNPDEHKIVAGMLPEADVFLEGFRGRSMENLGFGVEEVASKHPGIIYLSMRCYSWDGPWWYRAGFDMEALTVSGFTMAEGEGGRPRFPPTMVLNDYIAGYLGAAGIIAALRRRAKEGGSYHVRISLTRAAMWYASLGEFPTTDFDLNDPEHKMITPRTIKAQTPYGELHRLAPLAQLSKTPGKYPEPLLHVRGGDRPEWAKG